LTERIATTLVSSESELRDSFTGRIVWRNWSLDLFKRRRGDWVNKVKSSSSTVAITSHTSHTSVPEIPSEPLNEDREENQKSVKSAKSSKPKHSKPTKGNSGLGKAGDATPQKSAIQLAREKFASAKALKTNLNPTSFKGGKATGANARSIGIWLPHWFYLARER
jgi:nucleolar protein 9